MEIPTLNKRIKIKEYESPHLLLEDGSLFDFSPLPPTGWHPGEVVTVTERGGANTRFKRPSAYTVTHVTKEQKFDGTCLKGAVNQEPPSDVNKSMTEFDELDKELVIEKACDDIVLLKGRRLSKWQVSSLNVTSSRTIEWHPGENVVVSRGVVKKSKEIRLFQIRNTEQGNELIGAFIGYED